MLPRSVDTHNAVRLAYNGNCPGDWSRFVLLGAIMRRNKHFVNKHQSLPSFFQTILNPLNLLKCFTGRRSAPPPKLPALHPRDQILSTYILGLGMLPTQSIFSYQNYQTLRSLVFCLPSLYLSPSLGNEGCVLPGSHYWQKGNPSIRAKDEHCSIAHTHCYTFLNTDINTLIEDWKPAIDWGRSK